MKAILNILLLILISNVSKAQKHEVVIGSLLDKWHSDAAHARFDDYTKPMHNDFIFMGTDATERWDLTAFKLFAKPYFDKGKAWSFTTLKRNVYVTKDAQTAWFDELLQTRMKICRGSGVLVNNNNEWQLVQYVLSATIPNDSMNVVVKIKTPIEDALIEKLQKQD
jgi:hypothetical protein